MGKQVILYWGFFLLDYSQFLFIDFSSSSSLNFPLALFVTMICNYFHINLHSLSRLWHGTESLIVKIFQVKTLEFHEMSFLLKKRSIKF